MLLQRVQYLLKIAPRVMFDNAIFAVSDNKGTEKEILHGITQFYKVAVLWQLAELRFYKTEVNYWEIWFEDFRCSGHMLLLPELKNVP